MGWRGRWLPRVLVHPGAGEPAGGTGVVANAVHPGLVARTRLLQDTGGPFKWITDTFGRTPEEGADTVLWLATAPEIASVTGKLFAERKEVRTT
jgi:retinol dehydrogenase-12